MLSPEQMTKMIVWRQKAAAGTITLDEMKDAIITLRSTRKAANSAVKTSSGGKKASASVDSMLSELEGL